MTMIIHRISKKDGNVYGRLTCDLCYYHIHFHENDNPHGKEYWQLNLQEMGWLEVPSNGAGHNKSLRNHVCKRCIGAIYQYADRIKKHGADCDFDLSPKFGTTLPDHCH